MRRMLAIVVCKLLRFAGKLLGRGSSLPGQFALKVCPDVLGRVKLPPHIIAVTGSNGKTSTVEMIAAILAADGRQVVYNKEGSNQIEGVATLILSHCTIPLISSSPTSTGTSSPATATPSGCTSLSGLPSTRRRPWCSTPTTLWWPALPGTTIRKR